ncbi:PP2C family serine/threonine-protein phosphatase [Parabacteroides sp. Marseille-P3160]|uniref:PP2C family protein-serine/threonine phosphatase n=1 Tax=Parabacteroides sp. Marseille-P3160 TaxID=1917887 RepID=UPI0009BBA295|nr:protein phosphatase 2C domain-containing protein [Parabacteroides sp. Marseille-P3160]
MHITLERPYAICEKGGRSNNEDSIYPLSELAKPSQRLFLVCDGVGGSEKGEIASALACESIQIFFSTFLTGDPTREFINKAIHYTETRFDEYIATHPEAKGMATTLTLVYIGTSGITVAHIGDSRIYHFRNKQALFQTEDHSLVNSLVKLGKISPQEALRHPQRNVILRAIQGTERPTEADVTLLTEIEAGDYLFMCTDGILERLQGERLAFLFEEGTPASMIKDRIAELCNGNVRDNFSFYIIPIQGVDEILKYKQFILSFFYSFI